ncbi:nucleotide-diphospho-sugar transferase [Peziza echinospora]|nr:nucleotide-diphospho-sugar transferase [Peziza echinospora]
MENGREQENGPGTNLNYSPRGFLDAGVVASRWSDWKDPSASTWPSSLNFFFAWVCVGWFCFVWLICWIGYVQLRKRFSKPATSFIDAQFRDALPFVSILRPIKGLDSHLALTLKSTFLLDYPADRHELLICVASATDPCVPVVRSLIALYPNINAKLLLGDENVGPNPKIRTLSKAYREARGDIMWLLDSNIWVTPGTLGRMVQTLCGFDRYGQETKKPYKFVHHVPVAVNCEEEYVLSGGVSPLIDASRLRSTTSPIPASVHNILNTFGGALEETFLSTSHAKFYTAINTVAVAPCALGKSNMFRRSHLAALTPEETPGIEDFAYYICEDHMISERLWLQKIPEELRGEKEWGKHALGEDLVYQPLAEMPVADYWNRRTRWIRVRKYTNIGATLAEPETESLLCSLIGAYGVSTLMAKYGWFENVPEADNLWWQWAAFIAFWITSVTIWSFCDYLNFKVLQGFGNVLVDSNTPRFIADVRERGSSRRWEGSLGGWLGQWLGREILALPIVLWALLPGEIHWRGSRYVVGWDLKAKEVGTGDAEGKRVE